MLEALGISIDNDANIVGGTEVIQDINNIIGEISKNLNPTTLTLANQNRLNLMELVRRLSLSEITLIEKLNPGLMQKIGEFIGTYQCVTYTNKYGQRTSTNETITWSDLMKEKADMQNDPLAYLRFEDRLNATKQYTVTNNKVTIEGKEYAVTEKKVIINVLDYQTKTDDTTSSISLSGKPTQADAANKLAKNQADMAKSAIDISSYIENTQAQGVSKTTIQVYIDDFKKNFNNWGETNMTCKNPDEALISLAEIRNPEVAFKFLSDPDVPKALQLVGEKKGSLAGGKGQTPEMYYIGEDGKIGMDANGNLLTAPKELTVSNIAAHLNILTELYKSSRYDENGNDIAGDKERIE